MSGSGALELSTRSDGVRTSRSPSTGDSSAFCTSSPPCCAGSCRVGGCFSSLETSRRIEDRTSSISTLVTGSDIFYTTLASPQFTFGGPFAQQIGGVLLFTQRLEHTIQLFTLFAGDCGRVLDQVVIG